MHNRVKNLTEKIGKWALAALLSIGLAVGGGFGIAKLVSPNSALIAEEDITLPDGSPIPTLPTAPTTYWESQSGVQNYVWPGSGTKADPYLIDTKEAFAWFVYCCGYKTSPTSSYEPYLNGLHFKLTADLDMSGHRGYSKYLSSYSGFQDCEFDGGGHTISNIYGAGNIGIFNKLYGKTSIHDLTIKNSFFPYNTTSTYSYRCSLISSETTGNPVLYNINIESCYLGGIYTEKQQMFTSTLGNCGKLDDITVKNCFIGGGRYACGIAMSASSFKNCYSLNNYICTSYSASKSYYPVATGIGAGGTFYNCHNSSTVVSTSLAAGIGNGSVVYRYCSNQGNIKVVCDSSSLIQRGMASGVGVDINNSGAAYYCWNSGNVEVNSESASGQACGVCLRGNQNCFNTGEIKATGNASTLISSAFGNMTSSPSIFNLYNAGHIVGKHYVGGIFSSNYDSARMSYNLINAGIVESSNNSSLVGAICGSTTYNVINSYWDNTKTEKSGVSGSGAQAIENLESLLRDENEMRGNGSLT